MKRKRVLKWLGAAAAVGAIAVIALVVIGCPMTSHPVQDAELGTASDSTSLEAVIDEPGTVRVETVVAAQWVAALSGLLNLDHPEAEKAGLEDREEPIQIYFHALSHPTQGLFLIDTGIEKAFVDDPEHALLHGVAASAVKLDKAKIEHPLGAWLAAQSEPLKGVLLTHMHLDHLTGMRDVPSGTPVYVGPGEARFRHWQNLFVGSLTDEALSGKGPLRQWKMQPDPAGRFEGVLDVFGDQMVWALLVPGHTVGSIAYVARTPDGPVLITGDACHTAWGWEHGVEPGTFSYDQPRSAKSLAALRGLAERHPRLSVRLGHQSR